jgi:hypothetical protein
VSTKQIRRIKRELLKHLPVENANAILDTALRDKSNPIPLPRKAVRKIGLYLANNEKCVVSLCLNGVRVSSLKGYINLTTNAAKARVGRAAKRAEVKVDEPKA